MIRLQIGTYGMGCYREMWGSNGEYIIDGNLTSAEYETGFQISKYLF